MDTISHPYIDHNGSQLAVIWLIENDMTEPNNSHVDHKAAIFRRAGNFDAGQAVITASILYCFGLLGSLDRYEVDEGTRSQVLRLTCRPWP